MRRLVVIIIAFLSFAGASFAADDLKNAFEEAEVSGQFRFQFFKRDYDTRATREDIAAGGMLYYRTAPLNGFRMGVTFYTGQGMGLNDSNKDVYGLLAKDANGNHDSFLSLAESYISLEKYDSVLKIGRQELELPWINGDDNRLTPQTTQACTLVNRSFPDLEIFIGHITKMRGKASEDFEIILDIEKVFSSDELVTVQDKSNDTKELSMLSETVRSKESLK